MTDKRRFFYYSSDLGSNKLMNKSRDQWGNKALDINIPHIGGIAIFYNKHINRSSWFFSGMTDDIAIYISPDFTEEARLPIDRIAQYFNFDLTIYDDSFDAILEHVSTIQPATIRMLLKKNGNLEQIA